MRPGYFKVDETDEHGAVIVPAQFRYGLALLDVKRWMHACGIHEPIRYVPAAHSPVDTMIANALNGAPV